MSTMSTTPTSPAESNTIADVNDLPLCMQPGWDPMTPGREAQARFLDACTTEGIDARDVDPDGFWSNQW